MAPEYTDATLARLKIGDTMTFRAGHKRFNPLKSPTWSLQSPATDELLEYQVVELADNDYDLDPNPQGEQHDDYEYASSVVHFAVDVIQPIA